MSLRLLRRAWVREDRGANLVEFALASAVFFMTIFGILEFGVAIWRYNMASNLAQEGARWAAVRGKHGYEHASGADVQAFVNTRANGISVVVTTTSAATAQSPCDGTAVNPGDLMSGDPICVTVATSYNGFSGFLPWNSIPLQSTAKMVMAR